MSSTIPEVEEAGTAWVEPEAEEVHGGLGCAAVLCGATAITFGYGLLCLIVYGSGTDPFGVTSVMAFAWIGLGLAMLVPTAILGLGRRLLLREWHTASTMAIALGAAALLGVVAAGWLRVPALENAWLLPVVTTLVTLGAAVATGPVIGRPSLAAVLAVAVSGAMLGWGVESRLEVDIVWNSSPMRASAADETVMFGASESGIYEVRHGNGGCLHGQLITSGKYGPGWDETDGRHGTVEIPLGDRGLVEGENVVVVCVRHGIASGEARAIVVVDDTPPTKATMDIQSTTRIGGDADHRVATTRSLNFFGTFDGASRPILEVDGFSLENIGAVVDVADGRWSFEWTLGPTTDQAAFGVVVEDEAGNTTRSEMIHVRFEGIDPPPVHLDGHPRLPVECRGEPALDSDACLAWATSTLVAHPDLGTGAARLLLALPNKFGDCAAEGRGTDDFTLLRLPVPCPER